MLDMHSSALAHWQLHSATTQRTPTPMPLPRRPSYRHSHGCSCVFFLQVYQHSSSSSCEVSYSARTCQGSWGNASLDMDARLGFGPETVTVSVASTQSVPLTLQYFVYLFAGNGTMPTSQARVRIYDGRGLLRTILVRASPACSANQWNALAVRVSTLGVLNVSFAEDTALYNSTSDSGSGRRLLQDSAIVDPSDSGNQSLPLYPDGASCLLPFGQPSKLNFTSMPTTGPPNELVSTASPCAPHGTFNVVTSAITAVAAITLIRSFV